MLEDLTDFSKKRTVAGAFGCYLAYLVAILLFGALIGALTLGSSTGLALIALVAVLYPLGLGLLILSRKRLQKEYKYYVALIVALILSLFVGAIGALLPIAWLTTLPEKGTAG